MFTIITLTCLVCVAFVINGACVYNIQLLVLKVLRPISTGVI